MTSKFLYPIAVAVSAITTLLTPYLIKSADAIVARFDRMAPRVVALSLSWGGRMESVGGAVVQSQFARDALGGAGQLHAPRLGRAP